MTGTGTHMRKSLRFKKYFDLLIELEGWDTTDHAGRTLWGIAEKYHPDAIAKMKNMSKEGQKSVAYDIYLNDYYIASGADTMKHPLSFVYFDLAVNSGQARAKQLLTGIEDYREALLKRTFFYSDLAKNPKYRPYLRGWINRIRKIDNAITSGTI